MLKTVKLTKKLLNKHPADLLKELGAVHGKYAYPSHVYFSKADYATLEKSLRTTFKKKYKGYTKRAEDIAVGMEMLNYGPNESFKDVIVPGYALIDLEAMEAERKSIETDVA